MGKMQQIGRTATSVLSEDGYTKVIYHSTCVIKWDDKEIILNSGGWYTNTTKTRMNQASNQFNLKILVFQEDYDWYVDAYEKNGDLKTLRFFDGMVIPRH